uniref:Uncharacterized protein n=1 Tax=Oryza sativa subsp. japonica TaxID=39947 RepID=Q5Z6L0_ORYSJ|nr:hypothetical protein [Oryza sativa Japonica Group]
MALVVQPKARTGDDVALFVELPLLWSLAARSSEDNEAAAAAPSSSPDPALGSLDLASNTILGVTHLLRRLAPHLQPLTKTRDLFWLRGLELGIPRMHLARNLLRGCMVGA